MRAAIDKALALDPTSAWAHALNGSLLNAYVRDYPAGEREFLRAIALDSTAPFAGDYGWLLHGRGLDDSALAVVRRARRHNPFAYVADESGGDHLQQSGDAGQRDRGLSGAPPAGDRPLR